MTARILVVDDEPRWLDFARDDLGAAFEVEVATDLETALTKLKKNLYDLGIPFIETEVSHNIEECIRLCQSLGFPVILRPAFALEGLEGYLVYNIEEVERFARFALNLSPVKEVVIQKMPLERIQLAIEVFMTRALPARHT